MKNLKVFIFAILALVFVALTIFVHWGFIIPAIILVIINQRELLKKQDGKLRRIKKGK